MTDSERVPSDHSTLEDTPPFSTRGGRASIVIACVLVGLGIRVFLATHPWGMGEDSVSYLQIAESMQDGTVFDRWTMRLLHPLYPAAIYAVGGVIDDLELAARTVSLICSTALAALAITWWSRRRGWVEGAAFGVIAAIHHGLVMFGADPMTESLWLLLLALGMSGLAHTARSEHPVRTAVFAAAMFGAAVLVKTTALLFLPGAGIAAAWFLVRAKGWRASILPMALFVLTLTPIALSPQGLAIAIQGKPHSFIEKEFSGGADHAETRLAEEETAAEGQSAAARRASPAPEPRGTIAALFSRLRATWTLFAIKLFPSFVHPWFVVVPLSLLGAWSIVRVPGPARELWIVLTFAVALEWLAMSAFYLTNRGLFPGVLVLVPALAAGVTECWRRSCAPAPRWSRVWLAAPALLIAAYGYTTTRLLQFNATVPNVSRALGRELATWDGERPRLVLSCNASVTWYAGLGRVRFRMKTLEAMHALLDERGCDGLIVSIHEVWLCPDLAPVRDLPVGARWEGFQVAFRSENGSLLTR